MNAETLQERYPIGSRWRLTAFPRSTVHEVIAHVDGQVILCPATVAHPIARMPHILDGQWARVPDPPPSPITEPVTLYPYARHGTTGWDLGGPYDEDNGKPPIHLSPEGQEPPAAAVHRGWWWS